MNRVGPLKAVRLNAVRFMSGTRRAPLPINTIVKFVPQQEAWIVERMGKYSKTLEGGLAILVPFIDSIRYVQTLKEVAISVLPQSAITSDNVTIRLDGVLYFKIVDPYKASYGIQDATFAITQLAQTVMRSEIGQLTLDKTLAERANQRIVTVMNQASEGWGILCLRYEIKDIQPPESVIASMHKQVSADRTKRAEILESEGLRQSSINIAQAKILESEANLTRLVNLAEGEARGILAKADATAESIRKISQALEAPNSSTALQLSLAEQYIDAFKAMAKDSTTLIVPSGVADVAGMVGTAMGILKGTDGRSGKPPLIL